MKLSKKVIEVLIIITFISIMSPSSYANNNQDISIENVFTNEDGIWYPGRVESKSFYITNNKKDNVKIDRLYIQLKSSKDLKTNQILNVNSKQFKELSKNSTVKLMYKDNILFKDKLDNLIHEKGIVLSQEISIKSNNKELLNMTIDMDGIMSNDAQYLENIFSIGVAYKVDNNGGSGGDNNGGSGGDNNGGSEGDNNGGSEGDNNGESGGDNNGESGGDNNGESGGDNNGESGGDNNGGSGGDNNGGSGGDNNGESCSNIGGTTDNIDKLPQTGGVINSSSLLILGTIVVGTGMVLNKKTSKIKGGKHHG
ncbi:LPXTG cell wall anchor domain-containing protein [[Clostridium] dakarense]|uniref:LPXTG cell wall anchor domain-containing protein n=1 Tax=Faecalimicrobium dakarense TaxID=1301100 RepID=UPI0004BA85AD|nr:LPXTG cell wall anchor domain-containing protein [[Clostridium] dakarense]